MINITVEDILNNCDAKLLIGDKNKVINECFINSYDVIKDSCFIGIKGNNVDGSMFYKEAFDKGASVCILNRDIELYLKDYMDKTVIITKDTIKLLQQIASYKRSLFNGIVIGITGSVGKTSTKEMIYNVVSQNYKVLKTKGNQNSQIGLPLTIMRLKDEDVMVLEMGMNNVGQMHNLSLIAKPTICVITNVFDSHIGILGSRENILKAKLEIIDGMGNGDLLINNDNDLLREIEINNKNINLVTYGINNKSNINASNIKEGDVTYFDIEDIKDLKVKGPKEFLYNALAAYVVGKLLCISRSMIKNGINTSNNINHRLEKITLDNNITLIDDCYNASLESIKTALNYVSKIKGRKIIILGDVLELGRYSKKIHKQIGKMLNNYEIDILITIGKYSKYIKKYSNAEYKKHFKNEIKSRKYIKKIIMDDDVILVKGSNGMNLSNIIDYINYIN